MSSKRRRKHKRMDFREWLEKKKTRWCAGEVSNVAEVLIDINDDRIEFLIKLGQYDGEGRDGASNFNGNYIFELLEKFFLFSPKRRSDFVDFACCTHRIIPDYLTAAIIPRNYYSLRLAYILRGHIFVMRS